MVKTSVTPPKSKVKEMAAFLIIILLFTSSYYSPIFSEVKFAPYYNLQINEGVSFPSRGNWIFDLNLANDFGLIAKINPEHSLIGFYQIKYSGPGIKRQEGEQFTDRTMDHLVVFRHHWDTPLDFKLKSQLDYWKEYRRTGTNELWGTGLYDMDRWGGLIGIQKKAGAFMLNGTVQYHTMIFPNYTDLIAELRVTEGGTAESSAGKQDHALTQVGFSVEWQKTIAAIDFTYQRYFKQKVISETVQSDGTFYTNKPQQDTITTFKISRNFETGILTMLPELRYGARGSNQNYHHFENVTSTTSSGYFSDYYSYSQFGFVFPVILAISRKWESFITYDYEQKTYVNRPARNELGDFISDKQLNTVQITSFGFNYKPNPVTKTAFYLTTQKSSSNMKFEKYLPYNYTATSFGVRFSYQY